MHQSTFQEYKNNIKKKLNDLIAQEERHSLMSTETKSNKFLQANIDKDSIKESDLTNVANIPYIFVRKSNKNAFTDKYDIMYFKFKLSLHFSDKKRNDVHICKSFTEET